MRLKVVVLAVVAPLALSQARAAPLASRQLQLPPGAIAREQALLPHVGPHARAWIDAEARRVEANPSLNVTSDIVQARLGNNLSGADIEEMAFVVLMEATNDMDNDLQEIMAEVKAQTNAKQALRQQMQTVNHDVANRTNSLNSDFSDTQSLRLQMAMDRRSKLIETLSNVLKKISDTGDTITQNLK